MMLSITNFYFLMIISIIISLSVNSNLLMWMSLELNMLSFLPVMSSKENIEMENSMKYFLIQSWASVIFLMSFFFFYMINNNFFILMNLSLFMKLGMSPFHSWFISILKTSSFNTLFILSTIQKMIPLIIMFNIKVNNMLMFSMIMCTLIFMLSLLPSTININKVLALSSMNNIIWLMMSTLLSLKMMLLFMIIYMYMMLGVVMIYNFYSLNVFYQMNSMAFLDKFMILMVFMSLGGMPPMLGFLSKMIILKMMINYLLSIMLIFIIVMSSLTLLYFYLSRMYFYLTNIPSLKINFKLTSFSMKKMTYIISLLYINLAFSIYI